MSKQSFREQLRRELPGLLQQDSSLRTLLVEVVRPYVAGKTETDSRFERLLEEIRHQQEAWNRRWEENQQRWEEGQRRWEESEQRWEEWVRQWNEKLEEDRRKWEESQRRWEEWTRQWNEKLEEDRRKWEESQQRWEESERRWEEWTRQWNEKLEEDRRKWEENQRRWEESEQRWKEWTRQWNEKLEEDRRKWEENQRRWEESEQRWKENQQRWEESEQRWKEWVRQWNEKLEEDRRKWEENQRRWEENQKVINDILKDLREQRSRYDQGIGALGARWGLQAEAAFRSGVAGILKAVAPEVEVLHVVEKDEKGEVFGHPDQVELDLIIKDGLLILAEIKSSVSKSDVYTFERKARFYEKHHGRKVDRLMIISPMVDFRARQAAEKLGIEVYSYAEEAAENL